MTADRPADELADRFHQWLLHDQGVTEAQAGAIVSAMRLVIRDALCWRSYWHPDEIAARLEAELAEQRAMDAAEWAPIAAHARRLSRDVATGYITPPPPALL